MNNPRRVAVWILAMTAVFAASASSQNVTKVGTTAAKFLSIPVGARALAMGGAFVALANDASAMYWNPSGIASITQSEAVFTHADWLADISFNYGGVVVPIGEIGNIGVNFTSMTGWMLAYLRGPDVVANWIEHYAGTDGRTIMLLLAALFIIVGDFVDAVPAIIIFMPILLRLQELGNINPVHLGVVIVTTMAFGLITPPYGLTLLMASKFCNVRFSKALVRSLPLYVVFLAAILFTIFFPKIILWLPKLLLPESVGCFKSPAGTGYICPP